MVNLAVDDLDGILASCATHRVEANAIPEPLAAQLREQFSDAELVELTFLIGFINMLNLFNNCLQVRYNGEYSLLRTPVG
jgi:alkylhydroperoxidase family enzyme